MDQTFAQLPEEYINGTFSHWICAHASDPDLKAHTSDFPKEKEGFLAIESLLYIECKHVNNDL